MAELGNQATVVRWGLGETQAARCSLRRRRFTGEAWRLGDARAGETQADLEPVSGPGSCLHDHRPLGPRR